MTSYKGLLAARFFLGLLEGKQYHYKYTYYRLTHACRWRVPWIGPLPLIFLSPSTITVEASFFNPFSSTNNTIAHRVSAFFSTASLSGAFSGLLAYGIIRMEGIGGRPGWAWIFILEGSLTVLFGVVSFFILPRSPAHARFLDEREKAYVAAQLKEDGATGSSEEMDSFSWYEVRQAFALPQVWMLAVLFFFGGELFFFVFMERKSLNPRSSRYHPLFACLVCQRFSDMNWICTSSFLLYSFTPSIVQELGYTNASAQLMSVPPFVCAFVGQYGSCHGRKHLLTITDHL